MQMQVLQLAALIQSRQVTSVELVEIYTARMKRYAQKPVSPPFLHSDLVLAGTDLCSIASSCIIECDKEKAGSAC